MYNFNFLENEYFNITLKDKTTIEFNNEKLYKILKNINII